MDSVYTVKISTLGRDSDSGQEMECLLTLFRDPAPKTSMGLVIDTVPVPNIHPAVVYFASYTRVRCRAESTETVCCY